MNYLLIIIWWIGKYIDCTKSKSRTKKEIRWTETTNTTNTETTTTDNQTNTTTTTTTRRTRKTNTTKINKNKKLFILSYVFDILYMKNNNELNLESMFEEYKNAILKLRNVYFRNVYFRIEEKLKKEEGFSLFKITTRSRRKRTKTRTARKQ